MKIIPEESYGIIENLIAGMIFFSPNFLYWFSFVQERVWILFLYNYFIIFILVSSVSHFRFNRRYMNTKK